MTTFEPKSAALPDGMKAGDVLLRYQQTAIREISLHALMVIEKSRRIGLTWGLAAHAALTAASARNAGGMKVWYMGYDMEMAREFIDVVGMWSTAFGLAASEVGETILKDPDGDIKAFRVTFASGFEVVALPSVARALRGKQGLVILDEAAFMTDLEEVLKAALALMIWGGRVIAVSTHDGVDNPFNLLIDDIKTGRRKGGTLKITFDDALADGLYERVALVSPKALPPKDEWVKNIRDVYGDNASEELDCIPKSGSGSWLNPGDIAACEHPDAGKPELYQKGLVYVGYDVARRRDFAVIWAFEIIDGVLWLRERYEVTNTKFSEQSAHLKDVFRRYRVARAKIDQTGMGEKVVEDEVTAHGSRVEGELLTGPNRLYLASLLRDRFERGTIRIPSDPMIRVDLRSLKRASKNNKQLAEGDTHPDMFWAAALACAAAEGDFSVYDYQSARMLNDGDDGLFEGRWGRRDEVTTRGFGKGGW